MIIEIGSEEIYSLSAALCKYKDHLDDLYRRVSEIYPNSKINFTTGIVLEKQIIDGIITKLGG
jgi:hypothetical protein